MKFKFATLFTLFFVFATYAQVATQTESEVVFQNLLIKTAERSAGVSMTVLAPNFDIEWSGAVGYDSKAKDQKLSVEQPFRIASISKTFTAVGVLRLMEMGKVAINAPIRDYISEAHIAILEQDGYDLDAITVKHCLQHTSGLFDYAMGNDDYVLTAIQDPGKRWTRTEQIQFAVDHGEPVGKPGEKFHYSDTGYVLLGEIIERQTGKGLAEGYKALIDFEKLDLKSTWLQSLEPAPEGLPRLVRTYLETIEATEWDNSVDLYGGGGYVSTTDDLAKFYQGLFNGKIFEKPGTLEIMLTKNGMSGQGNLAESYRMGIWEIKTPDGNGYMHNGFWESVVIHFPAYNTTIALNYVDGYNNDMMKEAFKEIVRLATEE